MTPDLTTYAEAMTAVDTATSQPCRYCEKPDCTGDQRTLHEGWHRGHEETLRQPANYKPRHRAPKAGAR